MEQGLPHLQARVRRVEDLVRVEPDFAPALSPVSLGLQRLAETGEGSVGRLAVAASPLQYLALGRPRDYDVSSEPAVEERNV